MVKGFSDLLIFCMTTALCNVWPQHIVFFGCIMIFLSCTKPTNRGIIFDIQCICKLTERFFALGFLVDTCELCVIGLLLVYTSGVETISASIIALYCSWSSHLPAVLYNFLVFSRNLRLYKALLLNYWSTPMATMYFISCSVCSNPLIIKYYCSNESKSNITFITLINALDIAHFVSWEIFPSIWKHIYSFPGLCSVYGHGLVVVEIVSPKEEERIFFGGGDIIWLWIIIIFAIRITMMVGALI